jgi:peroxiredoxin
MRPLCVITLFVAFVALVGCGSSPDLPAPPAAGNSFHEKPANTSVAADQMPLKFRDMRGKEVDLASFRGRSNVVLVVVKGYPNNPNYPNQFCPGCLAQLTSLTANYEEFRKRGAEVLLVFPGPTDKLPKFLADGKVDGVGGNPNVPFPLLTDTDLKAVKALGIDDIQAKPSTYILDKKGNVVYAYVGPAGTTFDRPSVKALLDQLDKLNGNS